MTIKGHITVDGETYLTCCEKRPNVLIDGESLKAILERLGNLGSLPGEDDADKTVKEIEWRVRYCIRNQPFSSEDTFEGVAVPIIYGSVESNAVRGCYSEWTCGTGDYDFLLNREHSLLNELASHADKYVWIELT